MPTTIITTIPTTITTTIPTTFITDIPTIIDDRCVYGTVINKRCVFDNMTYDDIVNKIKDEVLDTYPSNGINIVIPTEYGYAFQLTSTHNEFNSLNGSQSNDYDMSMINLKKCESLLKREYNIDETAPLIILKFEKLTGNAREKNVQYEVYDSKTYRKLDLSICDNTDIDVIIPIQLDEEIEQLYNSLKEEGYDLFDHNDKFYFDICTPFTAPNGADILLDDRIKYLYGKIVNITTCPNKCTYLEFSIQTKGLSCKCSVNDEDIDTQNMDRFTGYSFYEPILNGLKYSGYKTLQCYQLVFSGKYFVKNAGSILVLCLLIIYILFLIYYIMREITSLKLFISKILYEEKDYNLEYSNLNTFTHLMTLSGKASMETKIKKFDSKSVKSTKLKKRAKNNISDNKKGIFYPPKKSRAKKEGRINSAEKKSETENLKLIDLISKKKHLGKSKKLHDIKNKKKKNKKVEFDVESLKSDKVRKRKSIIDYQHEKEILKELEKNEQIEKNKVKFDFIEDNTEIKDAKSEIKRTTKNKTNEKNNNKDIIIYDDYQLNHSNYEEAILLDKRGFFKTYWSILKRDDLFLYTFISCNDYNLFYVKIEKFLFLFCTLMTINLFFFADKSIHKYYLNGVKYIFVDQIFQIAISIIITHIVEIPLCFLSMTDRYIYKIRAIPKEKISGKIIFRILKEIRVKLIIFYTITLIISLFYWYAVSAFCAVYPNTQKLYIVDCLLSLVLYIIDPFIIYALLTILRVISLKSINSKKLNWLYKFSRFFPIF